MTHTSANPLSCSHWGIHTLENELEISADDSAEPVEHRLFRTALAFFGTYLFAFGKSPSQDLAWLHEAAVSSHDSPRPC